MQKVLGFLLVALPATAAFATYGTTKDKMNPLVGALLAGMAYAATDIAGSMLSGGGISGLAMQRVGALSLQNIGASMVLNPMPRTYPGLTMGQRQNLGYLTPQKVGACFGTC